jgi:hypothetical protein
MDRKLIPISSGLHEQIKDYCRTNGFVMSKFIENILDTNFNKLKGENNETDIQTIAEYFVQVGVNTVEHNPSGRVEFDLENL